MPSPDGELTAGSAIVVAILVGWLPVTTRTRTARDARFVACGGDWIGALTVGRSQILPVTERGAALLTRARPAWEAAQREARAKLTPETVNTLRHARSMS
jgi:hypothetical protein